MVEEFIVKVVRKTLLICQETLRCGGSKYVAIIFDVTYLSTSSYQKVELSESELNWGKWTMRYIV